MCSGISALVTIIDFYVCASCCNPLRRTCVAVLIYGVVYTIWSVVWQAGAGYPIYPVIDWFEEPGVAVACVVCLLLAVELAACVLCWTKNKMRQCYVGDRSVPQDEEADEEVDVSVAQMP